MNPFEIKELCSNDWLGSIKGDEMTTESKVLNDSTASPVSNQKKISLSTKLGCGAFAGIVGTSLIYPLDFVKTRIQNSNLSSTAIVQDIYRKNGIKGFYRGLFANLIGISPEKSIKLAVNDYIRDYYSQKYKIDQGELPLKFGIIAGSTAGFCQVIVTNPMEMTKIQMQMTNKSTMQVVSDLGDLKI